MDIIYGRYLPAGLVPIGLYEVTLPGKSSEMKVLNDRPINAETPAHLLDDPVTPASRLFVRNNGIPPATFDLDPMAWTIQVEGEACEQPHTFTLRELQESFKHHTLQLQLISCYQSREFCNIGSLLNLVNSSTT